MVEHPILSYPAALELIQTHAAAHSANLKMRRVSLENAQGRVTAESIVSPEILPAFDNSAMDGFAVRSPETLGASPENPVVLKVLGQIAAGDGRDPHQNETVGAWEIMTGAPFPDGFDACVRIEDIQFVPDSQNQSTHIRLSRPVPLNQNRRRAGEDFVVGSAVLPRGHRIRTEDIVCLASLGLTEVTVKARPRVGIISTGKELVPAGETPEFGQIRNSTTPFLLASLQSRGVDAVHLGTIADDPRAFQELLARVQPHDLDLVITTGAISMGKFDFIAGALQSSGVEILFRKVAMRPGKPILFGRLTSRTFILGLPGNPISGAVGFRFFVDPFLRALQGQPPELPLHLPLAHAVHKNEGSTCFFKGTLDKTSCVQLHENQKPSLLHPLLTSTIWLLLPAAGSQFAAGTYGAVFPFGGDGI